MFQEGRIGRYEILEELARGAHGIVYRARDAEIGRFVALKIARGDAGPVAIERFKREASLAARLRHPDIVDVLDAGEDGGRPYFVMPLLEGGSLTSLIYAGTLDARGVARLLERVARAVHFAHERGVVHRDLKPTNVLLRDDSTPAVTDFGVARESVISPALTQTGELIGTPFYMPPEQIAGRIHEVDARSDVYAIGAILYEALARRPPFCATSFADLSVRVLNDSPEPPSRNNPTVDRALERIALRCLRKDAGERYATARDLADDLACVVRGAPVGDHPASARGRLERSPGWMRPLIAAALMCGIAALLATLAVGFGRAPRESRPMVRLDSEPSGSSVYDAGRFVGLTPLVVPCDTSVEVRRPGRLTARVRVARSDRVVRLPWPGEVPHDMIFDAQQDLFADRVEVTARAYERFVAATAHRSPPTWKRGAAPQGAEGEAVSGVSWEDAAAFAAWAGRRLPTVAEWRALSECDALADGVREWTATVGDAGPEWRVVCGGSFERAEHERSAHLAEERRMDTRARDLGFRCVSDPPWRRR
jgi:predicted Ser/Thr protein kinase